MIEIITPYNHCNLYAYQCRKTMETQGCPAVAYPFPACPLHRSEEKDTGGVLEQCHHQCSNRNQTARSWIQPGRMMAAKWLFAHLDSLLPSHNNITDHSTDGERANIEMVGQTNKSKVYLATCRPAGQWMAKMA